MNASRYTTDAVCYVATCIVMVGLVGVTLSAPKEVADYVPNGFILPATRYSLLFPLIACGLVLYGDRPSATAACLAVFVSTLWFGVEQADAIFLSTDPFALLFLKYPIGPTVMGLTAGSALLLPQWARHWFVPVVCAICGLGLGLAIGMEGPGGDFSPWFSSAAGLGAMFVIIASMALASGARWVGASSYLLIAGRILGSWLIAASLMLAALAFFPKPPIEPPTPQPEVTEGVSRPSKP